MHGETACPGAVCSQVMSICTSKSEAIGTEQKKVACPLQVGAEFLSLVEEYKYLVVLFTSERRLKSLVRFLCKWPR